MDTDPKKQDKKTRRVIQCLSPDHTPTQLVTYMTEGYTDAAGHKHGPETCVIDRNRAGQFVLRADAKHYEEQLEALREVCRRKPHHFREVSFDAENVLTPEWKPAQTAVEELQEAKMKLVEDSDLINTLKAGQDAKDKQIIELSKQLADLKRK